MRGVDRDIPGLRGQCAGEAVRLEDVASVQAVTSVHVEPDFEARRAEQPLTGAANLEVLGAHVRSLDAAAGGGGGKAILVGDLGVRAGKAGERQAREPGNLAKV